MASTGTAMPAPVFQGLDANGNPLNAGKLYAYVAGSTTPLDTYSDSAGTVPNTNPVVLDANGSATVRLGSGTYKFVLKDSTGTSTLWSEDQIGRAHV